MADSKLAHAVPRLLVEYLEKGLTARCFFEVEVRPYADLPRGYIIGKRSNGKKFRGYWAPSCKDCGRTLPSKWAGGGREEGLKLSCYWFSRARSDECSMIAAERAMARADALVRELLMLQKVLLSGNGRVLRPLRSFYRRINQFLGGEHAEEMVVRARNRLQEVRTNVLARSYW